MRDYESFLKTKRIEVRPTGFDHDDFPDYLLPLQRECLKWSLKRGKAAVFADCGLGKTLIELVFADLCSKKAEAPALILTPLSVSHQMIREAEKFGVPARIVADKFQVGSGVNITNYQKIDKFDSDAFGCVVLDESGILKAFEGATRKAITDFGKLTPYRLACSATPAPNDRLELSNHSEFLGMMTGKEIIALYFTQDGNSSQTFRLKRHAEQAYWDWVKQWAVAIRRPSDIGLSDEGYSLPELVIHEPVLESKPLPGQMFALDAVGLHEQRKAKRDSIEDRVALAASLVAAEPDEPWVIWCELNDESTLATKAIPGAVEVAGKHSDELKADRFRDFSEGRFKVLVTKPSIGGFGMNWQHCARSIFLSPSHSYEQTYQCVRRVWRFGQNRDVHIYTVTTERDGLILDNFRRKGSEADEMFTRLIRPEGLIASQAVRTQTPYFPTHPMILPQWLKGGAA